MTEPTDAQRRAYTETERRHNDHLVLDAEHHNAPKDEYDDRSLRWWTDDAVSV